MRKLYGAWIDLQAFYRKREERFCRESAEEKVVRKALVKARGLFQRICDPYWYPARDKPGKSRGFFKADTSRQRYAHEEYKRLAVEYLTLCGWTVKSD